MVQAARLLKSKVEIIFHVNHFNLAPHMAIMFPIHSLHLPRMIVETNNRGQLKLNITIKFGRNVTTILNSKVIIVQNFQLGTSMRNK